MRRVMVRAWEIARAAVVRFGGKVREYFAQALAMAWAEHKAPKSVVWELPGDSRKTRTWMAEIVGTHPTYKLARKFISHDGTDEYGDKIFHLYNGFYEANDGRRRKFIHVHNGNYRIVDAVEVAAAMASDMAVA